MEAASTLFPATRWTLLRRLREGSAEESGAALEILCRAYWYPIYAIGRSLGLSKADAEDATQDFFFKLLRKDYLRHADEKLGRLRSLLLKAFDNHLASEWRREKRLKRGGGLERVPWMDFLEAEERYLQTGGPCGCDMEALFAREWARSLLDRALSSLRAAQEKKGNKDEFAIYEPFLVQEGAEGDTERAAVMPGKSGEAFRVTLFRLRRQFRDHVEQEIALTLGSDDPSLIREEMAELMRSFPQAPTSTGKP